MGDLSIRVTPMEKTQGRLQVNSIDFAVSISGHGTALVWGHGMMANQL